MKNFLGIAVLLKLKNNNPQIIIQKNNLKILKYLNLLNKTIKKNHF